MRPNLSRILTGRFFETVLAGALLIQEETPEMDHYLVAGEHFLAFRTVSELRAIVRFIAEHPEQAEAIRRQGNAFARARYNDEALIASLDAHLFHTPGAQAGRQSARLLDAVPS
jgi:spore maturation protein CgeB